MPKAILTEDEEKILFLIKKKQMNYKECKKFLELFCISLENNLFRCRGGEKVLRFDGDGNLRRIETHRIDWRT